MDFGNLVCDDPLSEVHVEECNLCTLDPPINPVVTACGHCFCWPCMYNFMQGEAKPCPMCSTMLSNDVSVAPAFDTLGSLVLRLPAAEEVRGSEPIWDDDMLDWSRAYCGICTNSNANAFAFGGGVQCDESLVSEFQD